MKSVFMPEDQQGVPVHAHGGHIISWQGYYYWIGENRTGRNKVSCYRSQDLEHWFFCNHILTLDSCCKKHYIPTDLRLEVGSRKANIGQGCNIERPKVIYNNRTKQFVMWLHWELPDDYSQARCAVAVCDTIDGDYTYLGSFRPLGHMSRDCTLFVDDDDTAYFISTANDNMDLHIYKLTDDYLSVEYLAKVLWNGQQREAPILFKRNDLYYMITSACTGWAPNQSSYGYAHSIAGEWSIRYDLGDSTTYHSQPTCVLTLQDDKTHKTTHWYLGDRWGGEKDAYFQSRYMLLPLHFKDSYTIAMDYVEDVFPFS